MKRLAAALCACICMLPIFGARAEIRPLLDRTFSKYRTLGASVAVFQNGEITFTHVFGTEEPGGAAIAEDTVFQAGSISKMAANIGLMQLLAEKGIPLDAELGGVLGVEIRHPRYPDTPVTLRQLMTHTASLNDGGFYNKALQGRAETLADVFADPAYGAFLRDHRPGTHREYSNFGGGLIGCLIEQLSGVTLNEYMQEHVFGPLGICAAYGADALPPHVPAADIYRMPEMELGMRLRSESPKTPKWDPQRNYDLTAGKLTLSAVDLAKILIALCDGGIYGNARILSESAAAEMITPQDWRGSVNCKTGNGLFMNIRTDAQVQGRTLYGHGGKAYGMLCAAYFDPADRTGVVMLTNGCSNGAGPTGVGQLGREILTLCYEQIIDPTHEVRNPFAVE